MLFFLTLNASSPEVIRQQLTKPKPVVAVQAQKPLTLSDFSPTINKEKASVVKVTGYACGYDFYGTGFIVAPDLVATNAHVVAGISSPQVADDNSSYSATTVVFDPKLDFAILRINNLPDKSLPLNQSSSYAVDWVGSHNGDHDVFMGYPGGGGFQADLAVISDEYDADMSNIYGNSMGSRDVYKITAHVVSGSSGSPLIQQDGKVAGIVFGTIPGENSEALVMPTTDFYSEVQQAKTVYTPVSNNQECADLGVR